MSDLRKAAEMALERLESHEYWMDEEAIKALRQALAQPEQEPVAWMGVEDPTYLSFGKPNWINTIPLYTAPPKREWVGLTDEEMKKTWYEMQNIMGWYSFQEISQAVEDKLKEKNNG